MLALRAQHIAFHLQNNALHPEDDTLDRTYLWWRGTSVASRSSSSTAAADNMTANAVSFISSDESDVLTIES